MIEAIDSKDIGKNLDAPLCDGTKYLLPYLSSRCYVLVFSMDPREKPEMMEVKFHDANGRNLGYILFAINETNRIEGREVSKIKLLSLSCF